MADGRDHVSAVVDGSAIDVAGAGLTPKFANIATAGSGDTTIVSAVTGKKIRVISAFLIAAGDVDVYFVDGNNTAFCGDGTNGLDLTANSGFTLDYNPVGWFETGSGFSLDINLSGAVRVAGCVTYIEV